MLTLDHFADWLHDARHERGLELEDLARRVGASRRWLEDLEECRLQVPPPGFARSLLERHLRALDLVLELRFPVDELLGAAT